MIRNWGTFGADEFAEELIGSPSHPAHAEFLAVLEDPLLKDPIVSPWQPS